MTISGVKVAISPKAPPNVKIGIMVKLNTPNINVVIKCLNNVNLVIYIYIYILQDLHLLASCCAYICNSYNNNKICTQQYFAISC